MGKKRVAHDMQPEASSSFLAGQVQPTAGQGEVGIQQTITKPEISNIIDNLKQFFLYRINEKTIRMLEERMRFLDEEDKVIVLYKLNKLAQSENNFAKIFEILASTTISADFKDKILEVKA